MTTLHPVPFVAAVASANAESWRQAGELGLALLLSAVVGVERESRQKSAGLRTHTLVGVGAAVFTLISKYGFDDVLRPGHVVLDPSRMAAQIVTGVGFLGAGIIFVRRDAVKGLTTAAAVWVTAAIGACAGAGLPVLAVLATAAYLLVVVGFPQIERHLPRSSTSISTLRVRYSEGRGLLRDLLRETTTRGFTIDDISTETTGPRGGAVVSGAATVEVTLRVHGKASVHDLAVVLTEMEGIEAVVTGDPDAIDD